MTDYVTCPGCGHTVRVRVDGKLQKHGLIQNAYGERSAGHCPKSEAPVVQTYVEVPAIHEPECNAGCIGDSHVVLGSPLGEPFRGQDV
jgi:hypothetical protein